MWAVLADRSAYADWVAGTSRSHGGTGEWPQEGASLEHDVELGPWSVSGTTVVREQQRPARLALEVDSGGAVHGAPGANAARAAMSLPPVNALASRVQRGLAGG
ncbi:hypothetical protein [Actinacidiphila bryophytorum]|uniref:SRPBCC family protein n=1 Tax=Actinacidiphila bryophytorum TaxID=1436133 RepID=A0A9W4H2L8_9ACTN|nr:hypothetical protein [Actinacidiphila bryophytorum]MBM9436959.1 hypothetical protein [Actinacidiphila bryophytorum]MBN6542414.1 hypothetical protein [Actinacidiphila bryophytorum]CAG7645988.1 hypothetical protein SBRY_40298 [Actinacidiphila bryophytorum]